jgi:hypothetical protein
MSKKSWLDEFYPVSIPRVAKENAKNPVALIQHSLTKWRGLTPESLNKHELRLALGYNPSVKTSKDMEVLCINSDSCSLCAIYLHEEEQCSRCPLYKVLGGRCDDNKGSPYQTFACTGNPEPMIEALEKALEYVQNQE